MISLHKDVLGCIYKNLGPDELQTALRVCKKWLNAAEIHIYLAPICSEKTARFLAENLPRLKSVNLEHVHQVKKIAAIFKKVPHLKLKIGLSLLSHAPYLKKLDLSSALEVNISEISLASLEELNLEDTNLEDRNISELSRLTHLKTLNLSNNHFSDQGIQQLSALFKLTKMVI